MTRPFFSRDRISDLAIFARHSDDAISRIAARLRKGFAVDIQDAAGRFTLDSATEFLFGTCVNSLDAGLVYPEGHSFEGMPHSSVESVAEKFARAFSAAQWEVSLRGFLEDLWPLEEMWEDRTKKHMDVVDAYIEPILREALERKAKLGEGFGENSVFSEKEKGDEHDIGEDETLLDHLVKYTDGG